MDTSTALLSTLKELPHALADVVKYEETKQNRLASTFISVCVNTQSQLVPLWHNAPDQLVDGDGDSAVGQPSYTCFPIRTSLRHGLLHRTSQYINNCVSTYITLGLLTTQLNIYNMLTMACWQYATALNFWQCYVTCYTTYLAPTNVGRLAFSMKIYNNIYKTTNEHL